MPPTPPGARQNLLSEPRTSKCLATVASEGSDTHERESPPQFKAETRSGFGLEKRRTFQVKASTRKL